MARNHLTLVIVSALLFACGGKKGESVSGEPPADVQTNTSDAIGRPQPTGCEVELVKSLVMSPDDGIRVRLSGAIQLDCLAGNRKPVLLIATDEEFEVAEDLGCEMKKSGAFVIACHNIKLDDEGGFSVEIVGGAGFKSDGVRMRLTTE